MIGNPLGGEVVWSSVSQFEVAEGVLVFATVSLFLVGTEPLGLPSLLDRGFWRKHVASPLSYLCTALAALGALSFGLLALCNLKRLDSVIDLHGWDLVQYPLRVFGYLGGSAMGQDGRLGYGALALLVWGVTTVFLSMGVGLGRAIRLFALPSVLFLSVVVLLFDPREMDSQALNLVAGLTYRGVSLLSNWSLLTVSLPFTVISLAHEALEGHATFPARGRRLASLMRAARASGSGARARKHVGER